MTASHLVAVLAGRGIRLELTSDGIEIRDANGPLAPSIETELRRRTVAIRAALLAPVPAHDPWLDDPIRPRVGEQRRGFSVLDMIAEYRRRHAVSAAFMFHRVTSCDLWERNPTDDEMEVFFRFLWSTAPPVQRQPPTAAQLVFAAVAGAAP